jgi:Sulfotransferase family
MQHKHLFILSPPYSGSTLLLRLLATSPNVSVFSSDKGEGMRLSEMQEMMLTERWNPRHALPWPHIRTIFENHWDMSKPVLLEKSPPNMIRAGEIEKHFENAHFIVLMRNPYAWCESMMRRRQPDKPELSAGEVTEGWLWRAKWQIRNVESLRAVLKLRYEEICDATHASVGRIIGFIPEIGQLDTGGEFEIHSMLGKARNVITNTNPAAIARLTQQQIREITGMLRPEADVLRFFGYELLEG